MQRSIHFFSSFSFFHLPRVSTHSPCNVSHLFFLSFFLSFSFLSSCLEGGKMSKCLLIPGPILWGEIDRISEEEKKRKRKRDKLRGRKRKNKRREKGKSSPQSSVIKQSTEQRPCLIRRPDSGIGLCDFSFLLPCTNECVYACRFLLGRDRERETKQSPNYWPDSHVTA